MKNKTSRPSPRLHELRPDATIPGGAIGWQKTGDSKGRGVFARRNLRKGETVEICPVIPVAKHAIREGHGAPDGYLLVWKEGVKGEEYCMPLGYAMLYNHSATPNIHLESDYRRREITVRALRPIKRGEELCWDYACDIWF